MLTGSLLNAGVSRSISHVANDTKKLPTMWRQLPWKRNLLGPHPLPIFVAICTSMYIVIAMHRSGLPARCGVSIRRFGTSGKSVRYAG